MNLGQNICILLFKEKLKIWNRSIVSFMNTQFFVITDCYQFVLQSFYRWGNYWVKRLWFTEKFVFNFFVSINSLILLCEGIVLQRSFFKELVFVPDLRNTDFHIETILFHHFAQILMKLINSIVNFFWLEHLVVLQNLWYFLPLICSVTDIKHHIIEMDKIPGYSGIFQQLNSPIFFRLKHSNNFFHPVINKKL
mgnify:CR=1 FL=1